MKNPEISTRLDRWHNRNVMPFDYRQPAGLAERESELASLLIYSCEDSKARGSLDVTSADSQVLLKHLRCSREICHVQESELCPRLEIHDFMNADEVISCRSRFTGVLPEGFAKNHVTPELKKKRRTPFEARSIRFHDIGLPEFVMHKLEALQL